MALGGAYSSEIFEGASTLEAGRSKARLQCAHRLIRCFVRALFLLVVVLLFGNLGFSCFDLHWHNIFTIS